MKGFFIMEFNEYESMYTAVGRNAFGSAVRTAVSFYGREYSFTEIFSLIDTLADNLAAVYRLGKGDCVTLCVPNSPAAILAFYAANKLGAAVSLVHPYIPPEKLKESAVRTGSRLVVIYDQYRCGDYDFGLPVLVTDSARYMGPVQRLYYRCTQKRTAGKYESFEALLRKRKVPRAEAAEFGRDEPAVYLASGGTTGTPKIIVHNNAVFNRLCSKAQEFLSEPLENYESLYNVLPVFHGFGLCINMHMCMLLRRTNIMCIKFNAKSSTREIVKKRANILTGVPTMYLKLLEEKSFREADLSSIRDVFVGGDSVPAKLVEDFNRVLEAGGSRARLYEGYGLTETVTVCLVNTRAHNRKGSAGYPLTGTQMKIMRDGKECAPGETGEICLLSDQFMLGYLGEDFSPFTEIGGVPWLKTGDYGYADEDGYLYFRQRIKNMIKVSGVPVYPSEVENAAVKAEGVVKACAVGVPDPVRGQTVRLYAELAPGRDEKAAEEEVLALCRRTLIPYAVPKEIVFRERLPVNLIGKIDRMALERETADGAADKGKRPPAETGSPE